MHEFGVSLRLRKMVCMVSRVKQSIWKCFRSMKLDLESFGLRLKIWLWKGEREDDEMSRDNRRIDAYFTTQGIHQEIRSHELFIQEKPPKRLENKRYTSPVKPGKISNFQEKNDKIIIIIIIIIDKMVQGSLENSLNLG